MDDSFAKVYRRISFSSVAKNAGGVDPAQLAAVSAAVTDPAGRGELLGAIVRLVFQDMILHSDRDGRLDMAMEDFAGLAKLPLAWVEVAIPVLERPDMASSATAHGGRRIVRITPRREGWLVVNKTYYWNLRGVRGERGQGGQMASGHDTDKRREEERREEESSFGHPAEPEGQASVQLTSPLFETDAEPFDAVLRRAFEAYWRDWPRKVKRDRAETAFLKEKKSRIRDRADLALFEVHFQNAVRHYREVERREGLSKVPYGGTWFRSWRDERWSQHVDEFAGARDRQERGGLTIGAPDPEATVAAARAEAMETWDRIRRPAERYILEHGRPPAFPRTAWDRPETKEAHSRATTARQRFEEAVGVSYGQYEHLEEQFAPEE